MEVVKEQLEKLANKRHVHPHMLSASTSTSTPMNSMPSPPPPPAEWAVQAPTLQQAQIQLGLPPTPMPTPVMSPSKPKRKSVSRRSVVAGIASVTLVLGLFGGDLLVFGPHRPSTNTGPEILSDQTIGLKQPYVYPAGGQVRSMDWSSSLANQDEVVFATPDVVKVFNGDNGQNSSDFSNSTLLANANAQTAAWSPQSEIIAVGTSDGNIITLTPDQHYTNTGIHQGTIHATRWSPDGTHLASAGEDSVVVVSRYNVNGQLAPVTAYHGHIGPVYALSWTSDGLRVASVGQDGIVHIWDARTGKTLQQYNANADQLYTVAFSPRDDSLLAFAGASGIVYVWNSKSEQIQAAYIGHKGPVRCLAWTFDGLTIASGGGGSFGGGADPDFSIQIWDAMNGGLHRIYSQHTAPVTGVVWTPNTSISRLASCSEDGTIIIWPTTPNS
jgi:WD40 repeat protein